MAQIGEPRQQESPGLLTPEDASQAALSQTEAELIENERRLSMLFTNLPGMVYSCNNDPAWTMTIVSDGCKVVTGYERSELLNNRVVAYGDLVHPEDADILWDKCQKSLDARTPCINEYRIIAKSGEVRWVSERAEGIYDAQGNLLHIEGFVQDITERKKNEDRINELAFFDQLTGLPNRTLLLDRLKQAVKASTRSCHHGALLFIDLDNFKSLNDSLGHDIGDLLLKEVARRLTLCLREGDTVARFGGDEFVVILSGLSCEETEAANAAETVVQKIFTSLARGYPLDGNTHHSTASIGVTLFANNAATVDDLMKQADLAMYESKEVGRNAYRFFDPRMALAVQQRVSLIADLRVALKEQQFELRYQGQISGDGHVTGAEALIRWQHPQRGMIRPNNFIPLAEDSGMIVPLGHWVLETACIQLANWATRPEMMHLTIAVNVSARQFRHADFADQVLTIIRKNGANPQRLKLELTESLLVENLEDVIGKMKQLKTEGVGFSLDDFGIGYSSLSYLRRLPLDTLKIDRSFVRDVLIDPSDAAIAKTIVALAHNLGLEVIAEGVEKESQRDFLRSCGCHRYQGFFFAPPQTIDDFELFALRHNVEPV